MYSYRILAVSALLGGLIYWGAGRWPTGPAQGGPLQPSASTQPAMRHPTHLRLMTFNIHSGVGKDDRCDLARTSKVLDTADLIALQEVAGDRPWCKNEAATLSNLLNINALFLPTETHFWYPAFGNAILTRIPVTHWARIPLPNGYHMAHRDVLSLEVPFDDQVLHVLAVHMGKKSDRARQFALVRKMFLSLQPPAVLMGDLNTRPYDAMMEDLLKCDDVHDVVGEHIQPVDRVDFILTHGVRCTNAGLIQNDASDHPAAWAEIVSDR